MRLPTKFLAGWLQLIALAVLIAFAGPLNAQTDLTPYLTLGVNRESDPTVYRGWPILVTLQVIRSDAWTRAKETNNLTLAPGAAGWNGSLKITVNADPAIVWPFELVGDSNSAVNLEPGGSVAFGWWIHPQQSQTLTPGIYELRAFLDTTTSPTGWIGRTNSQSARIQLVDEPAALSEDQAAEKQIAFAYHAYWTGRTNEAASMVDTLLTQQPTNITALSMRGDMAVSSGNFSQALEFRARALQQFYLAYPDASEPPVDLVRKHRAALAKAITAGPITIIVQRNGANLLLEWNGAPGEVFRIESSTNLQNWDEYRAGITSPVATFQATVPATNAMQFLRIVR